MNEPAKPAAPEDEEIRVGPLRVLLSALFWVYLMSSSGVLWLIAVVIRLVTAPFDRRRAVLHRFTCWWAFHYVQLSPFWRPHIEGRDKVPEGPAILVANHQSLGDILVLFGVKRHFKWVSKASVFKTPFIGWNMSLNDYVALRRGDAESIAEMMEHCRRHLRRGSAIMMFPEGTRSRDGEIKEFKHGAFTLACELDCPVVPVMVDGTIKALPKSGWIMRNGAKLDVRARVLDAIAPSEFGGDAHALREAVRATMIAELDRMRGRAPRA